MACIGVVVPEIVEIGNKQSNEQLQNSSSDASALESNIQSYKDDLSEANQTMSEGLAHLFEAATALANLESDLSVQKLPSKPSTSARVVSDEEDTKRAPSRSNSKREIFPQRLMDMLNDESIVDIVSWLPNGKAFVIIRPDLFTERVLPKYLPPADARVSTKYPSFTRKLNRW